MTSGQTEKRIRTNDLADFMGILHLLAKGTTGLASIAQNLHHSIQKTMGLPQATGNKPGLSGFIYENVKQLSRFLDGTSSQLHQRLSSGQNLNHHLAKYPKRLTSLAILNGVMGDQLAETNHPFAIPMGFQYDGEMLDWSGPNLTVPITDKLLILVHGLCMSDLGWSSRPNTPVNHGVELSASLGFSPIYLRYNTGRHISQNGHDLALQLTQLIHFWPCQIREIVLLGHSMGGLVAHSACQYGTFHQQPWLKHLKHLIFLGTPHHGAPLARAGNLIDQLLSTNHYSAPFTKLTQIRSAGITDLCRGNILEQDWRNQPPFQPSKDQRQPLSLPQNLSCHTIAASKSEKLSPNEAWPLGDGLVPVDSALGQHSNPRRCLAFPPKSQRIIYQTNHNGLLHSPEVSTQLKAWLKP